LRENDEGPREFEAIMTEPPGASFRAFLRTADAAVARFASDVVDRLLADARDARATDVHLTPDPSGQQVAWRIDGVLHQVALLPAATAPNVVARLKVMADLLTYRNDVPQEGRIRTAPGALETRVSTFPTLHGERAVVRMFAAHDRYSRLDELGLPTAIAGPLHRLLMETSGLIILAGPAGSGKTTTLYACLRELVAQTGGARCLTTLEDPIEVAVPGVCQSQVNPVAGFTLESGLRSMMRQDPEVIGVGEVRDRSVAQVAFQAALSGHLVITTLHAGSAAGALGRLADLDIEPYLIRSGLRAVIFQRLARKLCSCARPVDDTAAPLGLDVRRAWGPAGCPDCEGTGYHGRIVLAEAVSPERGALAQAVLQRADVPALETAARADGLVDRWRHAAEAIEAGLTSPIEVRRVLGFE
jgi:type II secretory ATPase GspE/PulE/Tfp pilus assembly ATPase PilB-like protein